MESNLQDLDLYDILGIQAFSSVSDVKKAYRKKALSCHPDKNPNNPNATKEFHQLSEILEILTNDAARAAYDRVLKGRKEAALRHKDLDSKRRKLKEDLEARENLAAQSSKRKKTEEEELKDLIAKLREEGSRLVREEMEYVNRKVRETLQNDQELDSSSYRVKIKWKADKKDPSNGGYDYQMLHRFLQKYGDIETLVVSSKKNGSALVEFKSSEAAQLAIDLEQGLSHNPLKCQWLNAPSTKKPFQSRLLTETDFETLEMRTLRQAQERQRLIEQMMEDDKLAENN